MLNLGSLSVKGRTLSRKLRRRTFTLIAGLALAVPVLMTGSGSASAGVTVHSFVSGLPDVPPPSFFAGVGPVSMAFDGPNQLLVSDAANLGFYRFGLNGSSSPSPITTGNVQTGLALGIDGELFAALYQSGNIDQVDPSTGAFIRQLNPFGTSYPCVIGLATDPLSGDLFFGQTNSGAVCPGNPVLTRIENPSSADPTFVPYLTGDNYVELTFAPDGTLYAVQQGPSNACAVRIGGTNTPSPPSVTTIACFPNFENEFIGIEAIALAARPRALPTVFVAGMSGTISKIDQSTTPPTVTPIVTLGTRVDGLAVGVNGLYATQSTGIVRITNP